MTDLWLNLLTAGCVSVQLSKTDTANDFQNLKDVRGKPEEAPQRVNDRPNRQTHQFS